MPNLSPWRTGGGGQENGCKAGIVTKLNRGPYCLGLGVTDSFTSKKWQIQIIELQTLAKLLLHFSSWWIRCFWRMELQYVWKWTLPHLGREPMSDNFDHFTKAKVQSIYFFLLWMASLTLFLTVGSDISAERQVSNPNMIMLPIFMDGIIELIHLAKCINNWSLPLLLHF